MSDEDFQQAYSLAQESKDEESSEFLKQHPTIVNMQCKGDRKRTLLHLACANRLDKLFATILSLDPNLGVPDSVNEFALHKACFRASPEMVLALIKADPSTIDHPGFNDSTPLMYACSGNRPLAAKHLVEAGCKLDSRNLSGGTALHVAASNGVLECVELLIAAKVDTNCEDSDGDTALDRAIFMRKEQCAKVLKEAGAVTHNKSWP